MLSAVGELHVLLQNVPAILPMTRIEAAAELFLDPVYERMLSLPLADDGVPVGVVSRFQLNQIFLRRYGRELYGRQPLKNIMNPRPLLVFIDETLEAAARYVTDNVDSPLREDFIFTQGGGRYLGMGVVLDLLRAMQGQLSDHANALNSAYGSLKASQTQLVQSEKMASLGQMVAGIAHEINTPLGYVRHNVEMLQSVLDQLGGVVGEQDKLVQMLAGGEADDDSVSRQLLQAHAVAGELKDSGVMEDAPGLLNDTLYGVDQIKALVVSLRNFSRLDQARVADVDLNDCLERTLVIANHVLKNRIEVVKRYGRLPPLSCLRSQINQVLLNLITNAAQAIDHDRGKLLLKTETGGGWVHVSIQDNGRGIPNENLKKIFDPFFTTKPVGQGTGLGLSISYQIVEQHGGKIRVASQEGRGTRFVVSLPLEQAPAEAEAIAA